MRDVGIVIRGDGGGLEFEYQGQATIDWCQPLEGNDGSLLKVCVLTFLEGPPIGETFADEEDIPDDKGCTDTQVRCSEYLSAQRRRCLVP